MINKILKIAKKVRKDIIEIYDNPKAICLEASRLLKKELEENGFKSDIIMGKFVVDEPLNCADYLEMDDNEEDNYIYEPLHYWIEIEGKILDITADQFQDEIIGDELEEITYIEYSQSDRYIKDYIFE
jgi:hypothetical protein